MPYLNGHCYYHHQREQHHLCYQQITNVALGFCSTDFLLASLFCVLFLFCGSLCYSRRRNNLKLHSGEFYLERNSVVVLFRCLFNGTRSVWMSNFLATSAYTPNQVELLRWWLFGGSNSWLNGWWCDVEGYDLKLRWLDIKNSFTKQIIKPGLLSIYNWSMRMCTKAFLSVCFRRRGVRFGQSPRHYKCSFRGSGCCKC